jgi:hypothetical protein
LQRYLNENCFCVCPRSDWSKIKVLSSDQRSDTSRFYQSWTKVFWSGERESELHLPQNPIGWPVTNRNQILGKTACLTLSSVHLKRIVWKSSVHSKELFEQFFSSFERSSWTWADRSLPKTINPTIRSDRILQDPIGIRWSPTGIYRIRSNLTGMYRKSDDGITPGSLVS